MLGGAKRKVTIYSRSEEKEKKRRSRMKEDC